MPLFEDRCKHAEAIATEVENLAKQLLRAAKAMKKAAGEGNPNKIRAAAVQVDDAASKAGRIESSTNRAWPLSDDELTELLGGPYVDQLIEAASKVGVSLSRLDSCRLAAFPVIVQVLPSQRAIRLDGARLMSLRPSIVVECIRAKLKKPHSNSDRFIEVLFKAYQLVLGENLDRGTTLLNVYDALTLLPESRINYGKAEFTRDVYELDLGHVRQTKSGATVSFPSATGTKSKNETLQIISPEGMPKYYYGVRFEKGA